MLPGAAARRCLDHGGAALDRACVRPEEDHDRSPRVTARRARRPLLLAGRTAAVEWASLLLRRAGYEVRLLERQAEGVAVRDVWSHGNAAPAESYPSIADAVESLDASALLIDFDDREGWPDGELPDDLPVPPS